MSAPPGSGADAAAARDPGALADRIVELLGGPDADDARGRAAWHRVADGSGDADDRARALRFVHRSHGVQTAMLAREDGADDALVVAALLHDVGHVLAAADGAVGPDDGHERYGADWLARCFGPAVSEPVRHHVVAKRYLVATRADYRARLADDSVRSLAEQGDALPAADIEAWRARPHFAEAVRLRLWDDAAKDWSRAIEPLDAFRDAILACRRR